MYGVVYVYMWLACMHAYVGIPSGRGLCRKPQEHLAHINRNEYWAGLRIARTNELGSEVV